MNRFPILNSRYQYWHNLCENLSSFIYMVQCGKIIDILTIARQQYIKTKYPYSRHALHKTPSIVIQHITISKLLINVLLTV